MAAAVLAMFVVAACGEKHSSKGFHAGRDRLKRGDYAGAIGDLQRYLDKHPGGKLASRAMFLIAKAHIGEEDLGGAEQWFGQTIEKFPESQEAHKARYKLAMIAVWNGEFEAGRRKFQQLADRPAGTLAPEARAMAQFLSAWDRVPR